MPLTIQRVGGPTAVLGYAGLRLVTDPTFDPPGVYDSAGASLAKLTSPAAEPDDVGGVDAVLLSHDQHQDNLDTAGRAFLARARRVVTTEAGAGRLADGATGLAPWATTTVGPIEVTALPALHGPPGSEPVTGPVIGFLLEAPGEPRVYVSGDNASLDVVREIAERCGPVDVAVLFAGAAVVPQRFEGAHLTLSAQDAAVAAGILGAGRIVVVHTEGWAHFSSPEADVAPAFAAAGLGDRLVDAPYGETVTP